jgi:hypothetical protein
MISIVFIFNPLSSRTLIPLNHISKSATMKSSSSTFWTVAPVYAILFVHTVLLVLLWIDKTNWSHDHLELAESSRVRVRRDLMSDATSRVLSQDDTLKRRLNHHRSDGSTRAKRTRSDSQSVDFYASAQPSHKDSTGFVWLSAHSKVPVRCNPFTFFRSPFRP